MLRMIRKLIRENQGSRSPPEVISQNGNWGTRRDPRHFCSWSVHQNVGTPDCKGGWKNTSSWGAGHPLKTPVSRRPSITKRRKRKMDIGSHLSLHREKSPVGLRLDQPQEKP